MNDNLDKFQNIAYSNYKQVLYLVYTLFSKTNFLIKFSMVKKNLFCNHDDENLNGLNVIIWRGGGDASLGKGIINTDRDGICGIPK